MEALNIQVLDRSPIFGGLSLSDYIRGGLKHEAVDPYNAGRILGRVPRSLLTEGVVSQLEEITDDYTVEGDDDAIYAPLLRTAHDFDGHEYVWTRILPNSKWHRLKIWAVDQVDGAVVTEDEETDVVVEVGHRTRVSFSPTSLGIFTEMDHQKLMPPDGESRRQRGTAMSARFLIGLSAFDPSFDPSLNKEPTDPTMLLGTYRHFGLSKEYEAFDPNRIW